jgi:hypothetical protein
MLIKFFLIILVLCRTKLEALYRLRGPQLRMVEVIYTGKTTLITLTVIDSRYLLSSFFRCFQGYS